MELDSPLAAPHDVFINTELLRRHSRKPDYEGESKALIALLRTMRECPENILQELVETTLRLCNAHTAGISVLEEQGGKEVIRWEALAGGFANLRNKTMPRETSPCGTTIDQNATQLMYMAERVFPALRADPPVVEALHIPFHVDNHPIGTVWAATHDESRKFDGEDERIMQTMAQFASVAWQLWKGRTTAEQSQRQLERTLTELERAQQAHEVFAAVVEFSDDAIIGMNLKGIVLSWNLGAERLFGYKPEEMIGQPIAKLIPSDQNDEEPRILASIRRSQRVEPYETVRQGKDGRLIDISLSVSPIRDADGRIIGASKIAREISQRKRMEAKVREAQHDLSRANHELEQRISQRTAELAQANSDLSATIDRQKALEDKLWQAQKLQSIGTLVGGVAHDFNNILNIIDGYASLIRSDPSRENIATSLDVIKKTVARGAGCTRRLLTMMRTTEIQFVRCDLNNVVLETTELLRQTFPRSINIVLELADDLPSIHADSNHIFQALLNLASNARDAMADGGRVKFKTSVINSSRLQISRDWAANYVCLEVEDNGSGMAPAFCKQIFETFFTTKATGKGTGLGLALVSEVVVNHSGFIEVASELGRGTSFCMYFPIVLRIEDSIIDTTLKTTSSSAPRLGVPRTVLLAEDEDNLCRLLTHALAQNEHDVMVASDSEKALELFTRHEHKIGAVLLDVGLPPMGGLKVIQQIKARKPSLPIILTSGYIEPALRSDIASFGVEHVIEKPYDVEHLVQLLGDLASVSPAK